MISNMDNIVDQYDDDCPEIPEEMIVQMRIDIADRKAATRAANWSSESAGMIFAARRGIIKTVSGQLLDRGEINIYFVHETIRGI